MNKYFLAALLFCSKILAAQQYIPVTDSVPVVINGLKIGYAIVNEKEKEVGNKGNFSRYSIQFYARNIDKEAKIILFKQGISPLGSDVSPDLVQFNCLNATGARFTSKGATIRSKPCYVQALVEDQDCATNKTKQNKRSVQIGYCIKAGEAITEKVIVIVPLNERPVITAGISFNALSNMATPFTMPEANASTANPHSFVKIKNFSSNTYLNNQNGPLACTTIENDWWSAQWQVIPVNGTNYNLLSNRWKNTFISNEAAAAFSSTNAQSVNAMWLIEPVGNTNTYTIRNVANNTYLNIQNGAVQSTTLFDAAITARWVIEQ